MSRSRLHRAPFAIASDGSLLLNLATATTDDLAAVLRSASSIASPLFVGIVLDSAERRRVLRRLDNAGAEAAALMAAPTPRPERPTGGDRRTAATRAAKATRPSRKGSR